MRASTIAMRYAQLDRAINHIKNTLNISDKELSSLSRADLCNIIHAAVIEMGEDMLIHFNDPILEVVYPVGSSSNEG